MTVITALNAKGYDLSNTFSVSIGIDEYLILERETRKPILLWRSNPANYDAIILWLNEEDA